MPSMSGPDLERLLAQQSALAALSRTVIDQEAGGVLAIALETISTALDASGAIAYRIDRGDLKLVAEQGLPRKAKPWLARLPLDDEPWFVAQEVARSGRLQVARTPAGTRDGHSVQGLLTPEGWHAVAAAPIAVSREVLGVLTVAVRDSQTLDEHARIFLETAGNVLALALVREQDLYRRREDRLREAKTAQLATIGLLASTVAGDLAAPLGRMELQVEDQEHLLRDLGDRIGEQPAELGELLELTSDVVAGLRTAQGITGRLLGFSEQSKLEALDLVEVVEESAALMQESIEGRGIKLRLRMPAAPLAVVGRRESLQLLFVQLLLHGASECGEARQPEALIRVSADAEPTGHVVSLESSGSEGVRPTGAGAFDAFLSKRPGVTADVGLAMAKQTVLAHNGHIEVAPSELGGTLLRLVFPSSRTVVKRQRDHSVRPSTGPVSSEGVVPAVVWIDEDELFVRGLRRYLKAHAVHGASSADGAKQLIRGLGTPPDLIFCDIGVSGGAAVELHRSLGPDLAERFVFVTGGVIPADVARYLIASGRPTLIKPIALEEVAEILHTATSSDAPPSVAPTLDGSSRPPPADHPAALEPRPRRRATTLQDLGGQGAKKK